MAERYLTERGLRVVDRNWRCARGELVRVVRDGECLVFFEVKTRRTDRFGSPQQAVHPRKAARLRRLAAAWLQDHGEHPARIRIDVIGILRPPHGKAVLRHVQGVGE